MAITSAMLLGAPTLPADLQAKVDQAIAATEAVSSYPDPYWRLVAIALLHIRQAAIGVDPLIQLGVCALRSQGRLPKEE